MCKGVSNRLGLKMNFQVQRVLIRLSVLKNIHLIYRSCILDFVIWIVCLVTEHRQFGQWNGFTHSFYFSRQNSTRNRKKTNFSGINPVQHSHNKIQARNLNGVHHKCSSESPLYPTGSIAKIAHLKRNQIKKIPEHISTSYESSSSEKTIKLDHSFNSQISPDLLRHFGIMNKSERNNLKRQNLNMKDIVDQNWSEPFNIVINPGDEDLKIKVLRKCLLYRRGTFPENWRKNWLLLIELNLRKPVSIFSDQFHNNSL